MVAKVSWQTSHETSSVRRRSVMWSQIYEQDYEAFCVCVYMPVCDVFKHRKRWASLRGLPPPQGAVADSRTGEQGAGARRRASQTALGENVVQYLCNMCKGLGSILQHLILTQVKSLRIHVWQYGTWLGFPLVKNEQNLISHLLWCAVSTIPLPFFLSFSWWFSSLFLIANLA